MTSSPFYYEIGNASGYITGGSIGGSTYTATTRIAIASGTKWLFGAYVAELRSGVLTLFDIDATHMLTGYHGLAGLCGPFDTVASCFTGTNSTYTAADVGKFYYDGGHFQFWGNDSSGDVALAPLTAATLSVWFQARLGLPVNFLEPGLASGGYMTTNDYTAFLRKILSKQLRISALLGTMPVCTLPNSPSCNAISSPIPLAWHYSVGHWVEDNPAAGVAPAGDGAFSSPGAFGFYPWIDSTKTYYGVLAREVHSGNPVTDSVACGEKIRTAFMTGVVQP